MEGFDVDFDLGVEQGESSQLKGYVSDLSCIPTVRYGIN